MSESTELALANTSSSLPEDSSSDTSLPQRVGRYLVIERVGAGGMGVVYSGYDPELDRRVAIKLVLGAHADAELSARLQREARSMARLSEANVVAVYDAGIHAGQVFIAMEFVRGRTLREWLAETSRPWKEVLAVFVQAGRGLAAAHAAGIVHRDFKPDNVLLDEQGRAKVTDFGLARAEVGGEGVDPRRPSSPSAAASPLVTEHGALLGTPRYMSPEQFRGHAVDARSDQFSFCVALWEGLYGERPFEGDNVVDIAVNVLGGNIRESGRPPAADGVARRDTAPNWVRRIVRRGLATEVSARYATMDQLISDLGRDPAPARRWWIAGGAIVLAGTAVLATSHFRRARAIATCSKDANATLERFDVAEREKIAAALRASGSPTAEQTWLHLEPRLEAYATSWRDVAEQTCIDASVEGRQEKASYAGAVDCLGQSRQSFEALLGALEKADAAAANEALSQAWRLPEPSACADAELMALRPPLPAGDDDRASVQEIRRGLAEARMEHDAGRFDRAAELLEARLTEAAVLGWSPLHVDIQTELGFVHTLRGDLARSGESYEAAFHAAAREGLDEFAADAAIGLAFLEATGRLRPDHAKSWLRLAETMMTRSGVSSRHREASFLNARAAFEQRHGDDRAALNDAHRARVLDEALFGANHVRVAVALGNEAQAHANLKDPARGLPIAIRALDIHEAAFGREHPAVANALSRVAEMLEQQGEFADARRYLDDALAISERTLGPDHLRVAGVHQDIGNLLARQGDLDAARTEHERALAIRTRALGEDHPQLAQSWHNVAVTDEMRADFDRALAGFERALELYERAMGPDHVGLALPLQGIGTALAGKREYARALPYYERALALREKGAASSADIGESRFAIARTMWELGEDREVAIELARRARRDYEAGTTVDAQSLPEIDAWLREHAPVKSSG